MNVQSISRKETETVNEQGEVERRVETTDYRESVGKFHETRNVQVIHQPHQKDDSATAGGGVLANAAASVSSSIQSAKDAISGK